KKFARPISAGDQLPAAVAVLVDDSAHGEVDVEVDAQLATRLVARGTGKGNIDAPGHGIVRVLIAAVPVSCTDGNLGTGETDVDCGGPCPPCVDDQKCAA